MKCSGGARGQRQRHSYQIIRGHRAQWLESCHAKAEATCRHRGFATTGAPVPPDKNQCANQSAGTMLYAGGDGTPPDSVQPSPRDHPASGPRASRDLTVGERMGASPASVRARVSTHRHVGEQLGVHRNTVNNDSRPHAGQSNRPCSCGRAITSSTADEWLTGAKFAELTPFNRMLAEFPDIFIEDQTSRSPDDLERFSVPVSTKEGWLDSPTGGSRTGHSSRTAT